MISTMERGWPVNLVTPPGSAPAKRISRRLDAMSDAACMILASHRKSWLLLLANSSGNLPTPVAVVLSVLRWKLINRIVLGIRERGENSKEIDWKSHSWKVKPIVLSVISDSAGYSRDIYTRRNYKVDYKIIAHFHSVLSLLLPILYFYCTEWLVIFS